MVPVILAGVAVVVAVPLIIAATKPGSFSLNRRASIKAPPEKIFPHINDFRKWGAWSPWEKLDPELKRSHSGSASGAGAVYEWVGNKKVGTGRMEILSSTPHSGITIKLDFLKPFEAHNTTEFSLAPKGDATEVTWTMYGPATYMTRLMTVFASMDSMVGKDFEKGLAELRRVAEG